MCLDNFIYYYITLKQKEYINYLISNKKIIKKDNIIYKEKESKKSKKELDKQQNENSIKYKRFLILMINL